MLFWGIQASQSKSQELTYRPPQISRVLPHSHKTVAVAPCNTPAHNSEPSREDGGAAGGAFSACASLTTGESCPSTIPLTFRWPELGVM